MRNWYRPLYHVAAWLSNWRISGKPGTIAPPYAVISESSVAIAIPSLKPWLPCVATSALRSATTIWSNDTLLGIANTCGRPAALSASTAGSGAAFGLLMLITPTQVSWRWSPKRPTNSMTCKENAISTENDTLPLEPRFDSSGGMWYTDLRKGNSRTTAIRKSSRQSGV